MCFYLFSFYIFFSFFLFFFLFFFFFFRTLAVIFLLLKEWNLFLQLAFRVVRRSDSQLLPVMFEADPTFCFHFVNCFEVEEHLIVDLCSYDDISVFDALCLKNDKSDTLKKPKLPPGTFRRYVLPINVTEVGYVPVRTPRVFTIPSPSEQSPVVSAMQTHPSVQNTILPNKVQWSALCRHTRVFRIPSCRTKSSGQRSFSYQAPVIWNQLPVSVRLSSYLCQFF